MMSAALRAVLLLIDVDYRAGIRARHSMIDCRVSTLRPNAKPKSASWGQNEIAPSRPPMQRGIHVADVPIDVRSFNAPGASTEKRRKHGRGGTVMIIR